MTQVDLSGPGFGPASGSQARQLVVFLHGVGADGADLIDLARIFAQILPDAEFLSPNAPHPCDMAPYGFQWFSLQDRSFPAISEGVGEAAPILDAFLDAELTKRGLTDSDLALVGFSQGTMMALHVALRRKAPCAAVIGYSGLLAGADTLAAELAVRPRVLLVHGDADEVVPVEALPMAVKLLESLGVPVHAHVCEGLGHGIDEQGIKLGMAVLAQAFQPHG